tara:strand:+ start:889 stop:1917 length:1029 start_codon:yes stop_codon:yes gene_type:complete
MITASLLTLVMALQSEPAATLVQDMKIDISIPTHPGLAIVGADPGGMTQVSHFSDLGAQLGSFIDDEGRLQPGFAAGGQPFWWRDTSLTLTEYRNASRATRILARTSISAAVVGSGDDGSRAGVGLHAQLLDSQDPRTDTELGDCLQGVARLELWQTLPPEAQTHVPRPSAMPETQCRKEAGERFQNRPGWIVGIGAAFAASDGQFSELESDGMSLWTAYRSPLSAGPGDLTARLLYATDQTIAVAGGNATGDETSLALVYAEESDGRRWELVADYTMREFGSELGPMGTPLQDEDFLTFGARYVTRVREGVWLELGYRSSPNSEAAENERLSVQIKLDLQD